MRSRVGVALARCLAVLLLLGLLGPAPTQGQELRVRLSQAVQRLQQGDTIGALLDLEKILEQHEDSWEAYYYRGRAQTQMGDDLGAHASFQQAAWLNPGDAELHFLAAAAAYALADFDTAWEQSVRAIQAGYERSAFDAMFKAMRRYTRQPPDLEARIKAPTVIVEVEANDGGSDSSEELEELAIALRRTIVAAPGVALVNESRRARHLLELGASETGGLEARLRTPGSDAVIMLWPVPAAVIPEMSAEDLAGQLEAWLAEHGRAG